MIYGTVFHLMIIHIIYTNIILDSPGKHNIPPAAIVAAVNVAAEVSDK